MLLRVLISFVALASRNKDSAYTAFINVNFISISFHLKVGIGLSRNLFLK